MKKEFSTKWKASKQPRKQRKYNYNAPLHLKAKSLNAHLSKELSQKHKIKRIRVRAGDKVKVMRGKYKGKEGKVDVVLTKKSCLFITGIEISKKDGSKAKVPIHASNVMIIDFSTEDKKRLTNNKQGA
ncbi:MAG: 50S ribosomal protein L24 [archaeon]